MAKTMSITTFRIREDVHADDVFKERYRSVPLVLDEEEIGTLYTKSNVPGEPSWVQFFEPAVDDTKSLGLKNASCSAVLLVEREHRLFAVTFGYGRYMLAPTAIEEGFGLRAALNVMDPERITSMDRKTLDTLAMRTREQASRDSRLRVFELDPQRDLLRSVTGRMQQEDGELGIRVTGRDALTVTERVTIHSLLNAIGTWHAWSELENYKLHFDFVDNVREVKTKEARASLDELLVEKIQRKEWETIWLTPRDILDWENVGGFKVRNPQAAVHPELKLEHYFEGKYGRVRPQLTIKQLKSDPILCESLTSGGEISRWSVYQCLYAEISRSEEEVYILSEGNWHAVSRNFVEELDDYIGKNVGETAVQLPAYRGQRESEYNKDAADGDENLVHMDADIIPVAGQRGGFEVCDLYHSRDRVFIHVKRYHGSSTLSHLFTQGEVSADTLFNSPEILNAVSERYPESGLSRDTFAPHDHEIAYVILGRNDRRLPFLSQVRIRHNVNLLRRFGYRVSLGVIAAT